jgi:hypothetical protein
MEPGSDGTWRQTLEASHQREHGECSEARATVGALPLR